MGVTGQSQLKTQTTMSPLQEKGLVSVSHPKESILILKKKQKQAGFREHALLLEAMSLLREAALKEGGRCARIIHYFLGKVAKFSTTEKCHMGCFVSQKMNTFLAGITLTKGPGEPPKGFTRNISFTQLKIRSVMELEMMLREKNKRNIRNQLIQHYSPSLLCTKMAPYRPKKGQEILKQLIWVHFLQVTSQDSSSFKLPGCPNLQSIGKSHQDRDVLVISIPIHVSHTRSPQQKSTEVNKCEKDQLSIKQQSQENGQQWGTIYVSDGAPRRGEQPQHRAGCDKYRLQQVVQELAVISATIFSKPDRTAYCTALQQQKSKLEKPQKQSRRFSESQIARR